MAEHPNVRNARLIKERIDESFNDPDDFLPVSRKFKQKIRSILNVYTKSSEISEVDRHLLQKVSTRGVPREFLGELYSILAFLALVHEDDEDTQDRIQEVLDIGYDDDFLIGLQDQAIESIDELVLIAKTMAFYRTTRINDVLRYLDNEEDLEKIDEIQDLDKDDLYANYVLDFPIIGGSRPEYIEEFKEDIETGEIATIIKLYDIKGIPEYWRTFLFTELTSVRPPSSEGPESEVPKTGGPRFNVDPLNLQTDEMKTDQQTLNQIREIDEQNEYIKRQILLLNQNVVKKKELEYITQQQDIDRYNRRILEAQKYKYDEANRLRELSEIANEEQYLTRQTYANYYWGIPSISDSHIKYPEDFFTGQ